MDERRDSFPVRSLQYVGVALAIVLLFTVASTLTGISERLHAERAVEEFRAGDTAEQNGDCRAAIEHYRTGLELAAGESTYRLALARCLWREQRGMEADTYLAQVLGENPTDGEANLLRAQILAGNGGIDSSVTYFERAITGGWPPSNAQGRFRARLELVTLLYQERRWRDLLPQLLQLRDDPGADENLRVRIAGMMLDARAPGDARDLMVAMVRSGVRRSDVYATLGRAYLARRQPGLALQAFRSARQATPDPWNAANVAYAAAIVRLDPDEPGLTSDAQRRRLAELGRVALTRAQRCSAAGDVFLAEAGSTLDRAARRPASVESARLRALALAIWERPQASCQSSTADERAVEYLLIRTPDEALPTLAEPEQ